MNMDIDDLNLDKINEIFKTMKPGEERVITIDMETRIDVDKSLADARKNSVNVEPVKRKSILEEINRKVIKKAIIAVVAVSLTAIMAVSAVKFSEVIKKDKEAREISASIGMLASMDVVEEPRQVSIVDRNKARNENGKLYYKHDRIARDLLRLDNDLFEYAFYTVCSGMGERINNKVGIGGRSNIDAVIYYLKSYSSQGEYFNQYVSDLFDGVNSLDQFLVKNNYLDKNGQPSLDVFKEECEKNSDDIKEKIESQLESKGTKLS